MNSSAEKITIFSQVESAAYFTVNKTVESVPLIYPDFGQLTGYLEDGYKKRLFPIGTNFNLISFGFYLPFGFEFSAVSDANFFYQSVEINYVKFEAEPAKTIINKILLPFSCYEMTLNQYMNLGSVDKSYRLTAHFNLENLPAILMYNIPDSFDDLSFWVPIFVKIQSSYDCLPEGD